MHDVDLYNCALTVDQLNDISQFLITVLERNKNLTFLLNRSRVSSLN